MTFGDYFGTTAHDVEMTDSDDDLGKSEEEKEEEVKGPFTGTPRFARDDDTFLPTCNAYLAKMAGISAACRWARLSRKSRSPN